MAEAGLEVLSRTRIEKTTPTVTLQNLANIYGTPLYVIDEKILRSKVHELREAYSGFPGQVSVAYSMKANFNPSILKILISEGTLFDVATLGELHFFLRSGGSPRNVIYTSVTEEYKDHRKILDAGVRLIAVSSYQGYLNLEGAAADCGVKPKVMVRVNPEVSVKAEVRASYRHGKFGVPFNTPSLDSASVIVRKILNSQNLEFEGFHFHLGSQITIPTCFTNALEKLENFVLKVRKDFPNFSPNIIDIGGGTPVSYGASVPSPREIAAVAQERLNGMVDRLGCPRRIIVESGRFLTAEAGTLISRVVNTKMYADRKFIFVDIGFHLLLDAALLRQDYPVEVAPAFEGEEKFKSIVAGMLCDTYDIFPVSPGSTLNGAQEGNLMIFRNVGAYSTVFNMPFHCQTKPPIVLVQSNGKTALIRAGYTIEELYMEEGGDLLVSDPKTEDASTF